MVDHLTPERRSWNMGRIKSRNTKPELMVRALLHKAGYRFTVNGSKNKQFPGKPDIVLPKYKTVIFVHGCFWHRHQGCKGMTTPKTKPEWWNAKFERNIANDRKNKQAIEEMGWHIIVIWECELKTPATVMEKLEKELAAAYTDKTDQ